VQGLSLFCLKIIYDNIIIYQVPLSNPVVALSILRVVEFEGHVTHLVESNFTEQVKQE
jgi:hypothetical protein